MKLRHQRFVTEIRRKVEAGDREAQYDLALCYEQGKFGVVRDAEKAFEWFKRGADNNEVACVSEVAYCYASGHGVTENGSLALLYFAKGADLGSKLCCYAMASAFETGDDTLGLDVDEAEARTFYTLLFTRCSEDDLPRTNLEYAKQWLRDN